MKINYKTLLFVMSYITTRTVLITAQPKSCSSDDDCANDDCLTGTCDTNSEVCIAVEDGTSCDLDGDEECTVDTCQAGVCFADSIPIIENVDMTYTIGSTNVHINEDGNTNIDVTFGFPGNEASISLVKFEALVYDNPNCVGSIIGTTSGAISSQFDTVTGPSFFVVDIDETNKNAPEVNIIAPFLSFDAPFWVQSSAQCGLLTICVQLLAYICGALVDFEDVGMKVEYDIQTNCEDQLCADASLKEDIPIDVLTDVDAGFSIAAYDCEAGDGGAATYIQGSPSNVCVALSPDIDGVCILDIVSLDLVAGNPSIRYKILPTSCNTDNLFLTQPVDYSPWFDLDAAKIDFLFLTEQIEDGPVVAHFEGIAIIGFGPDCIGLRRHRYLQDDIMPGAPVPVKFSGMPFDLTMQVPSVNITLCGVDNSDEFGMGEAVNACVTIDAHEGINDSCILEVLDLDLVVGSDLSTQSTYGILPLSMLAGNLLLTTTPVEYNAELASVPVGFYPPYIGMTVTAHLEGTVLIGYGCSCNSDEPCYNDITNAVTFSGGTFQLVGDSPKDTEPPGPDPDPDVEGYECSAGIGGTVPVSSDVRVVFNACLVLNPIFKGACILEIFDLDLVVGSPSTTYRIIPLSLFGLINKGPVDYTPTFNPDAAMVGFFPPAEEEIFDSAIGNTITAHFEGVVLIDFGTDCNDIRHHRSIQAGPDEPFIVSFVGTEFLFQKTFDNTSTGVTCIWYDIGCWFSQLINAIILFFSF